MSEEYSKTSSGSLAVLVDPNANLQDAGQLADHLGVPLLKDEREVGNYDLILHSSRKTLQLEGDGMHMEGDFTRMIRRVIPGKWEHELLIKAARFKDAAPGQTLHAYDCTAGLGEDSLILAASGFDVDLYESDPVIAALLQNALLRARKIPELKEIVTRMHLHEGDSILGLQNASLRPDLIYLDPMFPGREKSALIKKKFQLLHHLEKPCANEEELLQAAMEAHPRKIVIKRPPKGPYLAGVTPGHSISGKAVRFDVILLP